MNTPTRPHNTKAILSLVFGVAAWFMLPVVGAIAAVVCGHIARREIRESDGAFIGDDMAIAGIILGYLQLAMSLLLLLLILLLFGGLAAFLGFAAAQA
ncbi:MAG: DUF4190 domain-containing protein [Xanthomonadales bacterium]|nr:DUF4190 domain-containing protein [Xanthomonadales bacterium]